MRSWWWILVVVLPTLGCGRNTDRPETVWGRRGIRGGDLVKPRAIAIDPDDHIYLVDWTARIQAFDRDGKFLGISWRTPDFRNGRPSGLAWDQDGFLIVSDSHYHCVRLYSPEGKFIRAFGGTGGSEPGQLGYVSDCVRDVEGYFYAAEFGENQRISKFDRDGNFVKMWGSPGSEPGQFARIRAMAFGPDQLLYTADACNHRIQVFTREGDLVRTFGESGTELGKLSYPYDLCFRTVGSETFLYVIEYGNQRLQKWTPEGRAVATWGSPGREPGKLSQPWAVAVDSLGRIHVVDSENDRVQRIDF